MVYNIIQVHNISIKSIAMKQEKIKIFYFVVDTSK